jgi:(2Fe-2S) ferredoxin
MYKYRYVYMYIDINLYLEEYVYTYIYIYKYIYTNMYREVAEPVVHAYDKEGKRIIENKSPPKADTGIYFYCTYIQFYMFF